MKAASTVLTGGLGRRTARQRALILPTGTMTLAYLAYDASQSHPKVRERDTSRDQRHGAGPGTPGQPVLPWRQTGEPQRAAGASQPHAPSSLPFASSMTNTGRVLLAGKGSGQEGREPPTKLPGLRKWRRGRQSRRTGKPSPPGRGRMAKAPRLWKDGGQRGVGAQHPQRTRQRSTRGFARVCWRNGIKHGGSPVDAAAMDTDASWQPHGDGPRVRRRVRCKPHARCSTGG